MLLETV